MLRRWILALCLVFLPLAAVKAEDKSVKKLLLITDSGGFVHDSVGLAEKLLKELGPKHGWEVTCYRFTRDPEAMGMYDKLDEKGKPIKDTTKLDKDGKPLPVDKQPNVKIQRNVLEEYAEHFRKVTGVTVDKESCGHVNKETLKNFDAVLFFTTGNPLTKQEVADLVEWVKAGHAYAGTHCATDTLYQQPDYGTLVGAYFNRHPWHQKIKLVVEDSTHPAGAPFVSNNEITDEIYQFKDPYNRDKLHIILKVDNTSIDTTKKDVAREDKDFAVSWCHEFGKGKAFYTSLGHRKEVWNDPRFQAHLFGGLDWAVGRVPGDSTPSAMMKK